MGHTYRGGKSGWIWLLCDTMLWGLMRRAFTLFRSYTLTYLGPNGQSPACQSSQVVPFLRLLKEKVRESQASIESVEANSLCLLKVLESGGKPTLLNRCLENGSN